MSRPTSTSNTLTSVKDLSRAGCCEDLREDDSPAHRPRARTLLAIVFALPPSVFDREPGEGDPTVAYQSRLSRVVGESIFARDTTSLS
jgi:hypothetical protein